MTHQATGVFTSVKRLFGFITSAKAAEPHGLTVSWKTQCPKKNESVHLGCNDLFLICRSEKCYNKKPFYLLNKWLVLFFYSFILNVVKTSYEANS